MSVMRCFIARVLALCAVAFIAPSIAQAQTHLRGANLTPDVIAGVFQNYYRAPMPEHVHEVVQAAMAQGLTETRPKRLALIAFMAGLISEDAKHVERLAGVFAKRPGDQPERLVRAILYSGRTDWQDQIARLKTLWPLKVEMIDQLAKRGSRAVYTLKREGQPEVLDMNWAFFGATGSREALKSIMETLADLRATDPQRVAVAHAARLTLATQAIQHDHVYDFCQRAQMGSFGDQMRLIIVAANRQDLSTFKADEDVAIKAATEGKPVPVPEALVMTSRTRRP